MHDPLVVAFEIPSLIPRRQRYRERVPGQPRWTLGRRRRTNEENLGEPVYPWYRLKGYDPRVAGRAYGLNAFITVWHVEPGGRDAGEVCKWWRTNRKGERVHTRRWAWHVWHWNIQIHFTQRLRRFLFERCQECGRRYPWGYSPVSHQWDAPKSRWFRVERRAYHHQCSSLVSLRRQKDQDEGTIRYLFAALSAYTDQDEAALLAKLTDPKNRTLEFLQASRLTSLLGYERDDNYDLVKGRGV